MKYPEAIIVEAFIDHKEALTLSWRKSLWYRNQSIGFQMDWFLYDMDLRH